MRQYTLQEFPTAKTLTGQPFTAPSEILTNGTIFSMILVGRTPEPPSGFTLWVTHHFKFTDFEPPIQPPTTSIEYKEEIFFQILSYEPAPRDRYHVERVAGPLGIGSRAFHPARHDGSTTATTLHGVMLNRKLYDVLVEEEVYTEQRQLHGAKNKLKTKLATGDISHDEYVAELATAKQTYVQAKEAKVVGELGYAIGQPAIIRNAHLTVEGNQWTSPGSRFLKLGDRITAKRKNVHLVASPKDQPGGTMQMVARTHVYEAVSTKQAHALSFYRAKFLTTWGGALLDRERVLKLIGPGNLVRVATQEVGAVYFALMSIDRSSQSAFGVLLDYYLMMDDQLERVGEYWQFPLCSIIEVPESWPENANIQKSLLQLKQAKGLAVTGMTAVDDDE